MPRCLVLSLATLAAMSAVGDVRLEVPGLSVPLSALCPADCPSGVPRVSSPVSLHCPLPLLSLVRAFDRVNDG